MFKNIVFDIGNVLLHFKPREYLLDYPLSSNIADRLHKIIFQSPEWPELDRGTITEKEAIERFCTQNPREEKYIRRVMQDWYKMLTPIEDSVEILPKLKEKGYSIYLLSNYHHLAFQYIYSKYDFFKLFDGKVISYEVNYLKPENEIYEHLMERYKIIPGESLFIDDTKENTKAAKNLGFTAIHLSDPANLVQKLETLNLI